LIIISGFDPDSKSESEIFQSTIEKQTTEELKNEKHLEEEKVDTVLIEEKGETIMIEENVETKPERVSENFDEIEFTENVDNLELTENFDNSDLPGKVDERQFSEKFDETEFLEKVDDLEFSYLSLDESKEEKSTEMETTTTTTTMMSTNCLDTHESESRLLIDSAREEIQKQADDVKQMKEVINEQEKAIQQILVSFILHRKLKHFDSYKRWEKDTIILKL
jgi:hypothetical protein